MADDVETKVDPFDPERFRAAVNYGAEIEVRRQFKRISVRKPGKTEWVMVRDDPAYQLDVLLFKPGEEMSPERDEIYLIDPCVAEIVAEDGFWGRVHLAVNRYGDPFLWWARLPDPDGRSNAWHTTALAAIDDAKRGWIKCKANQRAGAYEVFLPGVSVKLPEPKWPDGTLASLLRLGFEGRLVDHSEHAIIKHLRGDA